jgi:hypothetical protein
VAHSGMLQGRNLQIPARRTYSSTVAAWCA